MARITTTSRNHLADSELLPTSEFRYWAPLWQQFRNDFPEWRFGARGADAVYQIPEPAITCLSRPNPKGKSAFTPDVAKAERAFTKVCEDYRAIGVWEENSIRYDHLLPTSPLLSRQSMEELGWTRGEQNSYLKAMKNDQDQSCRQKGVPGWLLTEPAFIEDVEALRLHWERLPPEERPTFPLQRAVRVLVLPVNVSPAREEAARFSNKIGAFLDKWGLMQLVTWDLPEPQCPFLPRLCLKTALRAGG